MVTTFAGVPFSYYRFSVVAVFKAPVDDEQSDEEDDQISLQYNFIFFILSCVKLSFYCTTNCFPLYELNMRHLSGVFLKKLLSLSHKSRPLCDGKWTVTTTIKSLPRSTRRKVEGHG